MTAERKVCSSCQTSQPAGGAFCQECGASMAESLPAPPSESAPAAAPPAAAPAPSAAAIRPSAAAPSSSSVASPAPSSAAPAQASGAAPSTPKAEPSARPYWILAGVLVVVMGLIFVALVAAFEVGGSAHAQDPAAGDSSSAVAARTEIDRPRDYDYSSTRSRCSEHVHLTDIVKDVGLGIDQEVRRPETVSIKEERELGDEHVQEVPRIFGGRLDQTSPTAKYIAEVGRSMLSQVKRKDVRYTFYLLEGTEVENALALPGGHVIITRPFYDVWVKNEAQLATALGHEIAHVDEKHPLGIVQYARVLGLSGDEAIAQALIWMARSPYSSALEEEADRLGGGYLHSTGYSLFQSVKMWEAQNSRSSSSSSSSEGEGGLLGDLVDIAIGELENLVVTHPNAARRACLLEQVAYDRFKDDHKKTVYVGRTNLQRQEPMSRKTY